MFDPFSEFRHLVVRAAPPGAGRDDACAVVVSGGKPGVGTTTLAVNLAAFLASDARRVVLIDADLYRADAASLCGIAGHTGIDDVLAGRKSIHEALQRGPAGIQVLAGSATAETRGSVNPRSLERLLRQIRLLGPHADWLIIDAGNQPSVSTARLWAVANHLLLVTSADAVAVMDTYALIKTVLSRQPLMRPLDLVVNQVANAANAADVHRRIDQSCRRFLGLSITLGGSVPFDPTAASAGRGGMPTTLVRPDSLLADAIARLARQISEFPGPVTGQQRLAA